MLKIIAKHVRTEHQKTQTKITFTTDETVSDIDLAYISNAKGNLIFSVDKITQETELAMRDNRIPVNTKGQSNSKKLRAALYEYWFDKIENIEFEEFYNTKIESIIKQVTDRI